MTNDLIAPIGRQLNIPKSTDNEWICQIIYSVAGKMALASLWDRYEDKSCSVSIQHFKNRAAQIFDAYEGIYPEIGFLFPKDKTDLLEEMYSIYLRNGFFYHSSYQISPAVPTTAGNGNLILYRSNAPDAELCMSGLGFYAVQKTSTDRTVANMFGLQAQTFESYLEELLGHGEWQPIDWPDNTEFLRLDPPFSKGYWQKLPSKDKRISLARYGDPQKNYVFYRYHNGIYQQKPIPDWRIRNYFPENTSNDSSRNMYGEYRRIAIALLKRYGTLPGSEVKASGDLIEIKLGYRLPPSEEEFFKLYSWPVRYDFSSKLPPVFTRKMTRQIYPMFKHELESIGYCFVEE